LEISPLRPEIGLRLQYLGNRSLARRLRLLQVSPAQWSRWRRVALFEPGVVCCRVTWIANDYGTILWQLVVLQAPMPFDGAQRVAGVLPPAHILLRAEGERQVKPVLEVIDTIETLSIAPRGGATNSTNPSVCLQDDSMRNSPDATQNHLLAALPDVTRERWLRLLERVEMPRGQVLKEQDCALQYAYFPTTAIVSLEYLTRNGDSTEIAVVGNEGVVGFCLFLGGDSSPYRAVVLGAGQGFRIPAQTIKGEFDSGGPAMQSLLRYTLALMTQIEQTAICNRHHSIDQQLCRWILEILDRLKDEDLMFTQELIAKMLGVRRESVTESALRLQKAGLIHYARGHITVHDRHALEHRACECYAVVKKEYDRLLPQASAARPAKPPRRASPAWDDAAPIRLTRQHEVAAACET
jgi:CRP-like cAMP-binding protein